MEAPVPPARAVTKVLQNATKDCGVTATVLAALPRGPLRGGQFGHARRSSRSYRLRRGRPAVEDARMRRLLPGMAALGALVITAPAQASFAPEGSPLAVGAAQPYGVAARETSTATGASTRRPSTAPGATSRSSSAAPAVSRQRRVAVRRRAPDPATASSPTSTATASGRRHAELQRRHGRHPAPPAGGGFAAEADAERRASTGSVTAADFNGDGRIDIAAPSYNEHQRSSPT